MNLTDVLVHAADHAVIAGDVLRQFIALVGAAVSTRHQMRMEAVAAAPVGFLPGGEIGIRLLGSIAGAVELGVMFARRDSSGTVTSAGSYIVSQGSGARYLGCGSKEARPEEEGSRRVAWRQTRRH